VHPDERLNIAAAAKIQLQGDRIQSDSVNRFGTRLNFATAAGGGVDFVTDSGRAFTIGYKFQHISNATRGNINPGFDQNLFYIGYTFKKW
jgi:hypothetical protein